MIAGNRYLYVAALLIFGFYTHQQHAGNGGSVVQKEENESKKISVIKPVTKCFCCKEYRDWEQNPLWSPCVRAKNAWMHKVCSDGSPQVVLTWGKGYFQRNKSGFIPLSMAIFRGKKEDQRENSRNIVKIVLERVGKHVFNMVMLRDHYGCSAWMHALHIGDPVVIETIMSAVKNQTEDPEAVWKLLITKYAGAFGYCKLTPLMVAVRQKNIPVITLLKDAVGSKFEEYLGIQRETGKKSCPGKKTALDFAGDDTEILQLLSVEKSIDL